MWKLCASNSTRVQVWKGEGRTSELEEGLELRKQAEGGVQGSLGTHRNPRWPHDWRGFESLPLRLLNSQVQVPQKPTLR